ncbi:MAG: hypothetical protein ABMA00_05265, partial [Gemmatimonas sp.]
MAQHITGVQSLLRLWFTFATPVNRRTYLISGLTLGALKYASDAAIVYASSGRTWHLLDYLSLAATKAETKTAFGPPYLLPLLAIWSLPFLWVGVSMSMRRALDAGLSAWFSMLFFVPVLNYGMLLMLSALPTGAPAPQAADRVSSLERSLPRALTAIGSGVGIAVCMLVVSAYLIGDYGSALFFGTPFLMGAVTAYRFNRHAPASVNETFQVTATTYFVVAGVFLLTAAEGFLCLLMVAPIALAIGAMGSALGRRIALHDPRSPQHAWIGVLLLPLSAAIESRVVPDAGETLLREVRSSVEIDAPPDSVWRQVIAFPRIPEPDALLFRAGVAYPVRAEIRGEGVGAVRYCVFSTGAFVEPITRWEPGQRLSFDVTAQPRALAEWSPYANVAPPHLDGYFTSRRGEFRLVALPGNRTRLEGSTWYQMKLAPAAYWVVFGDMIIHRIHDRVLEHIKLTTEGEVRVAARRRASPTASPVRPISPSGRAQQMR